VHLHGFALPQSMQSFPCWLHIFLLQALMTSTCVWQGQPETSIFVNRTGEDWAKSTSIRPLETGVL
jgi:hypothetical protein